jgi:hypothetical protein
MPPQTQVPALKITSYMNLEQAMGEVRAYLEAKKKTAGLPLDDTSVAGQLTFQAAFVARLIDISARLGQVDPNSRLGPPGYFFKRVIRKLIGWYSRPEHEFDNTTIQALQQIRHDMLRMQQQIATLSEKVVDGGTRPAPEQPQADEANVQLAMLSLFRGVIGSPAVRQALQSENPELLQKVDALLTEAETDLTRNASL